MELNWNITQNSTMISGILNYNEIERVGCRGCLKNIDLVYDCK